MAQPVWRKLKDLKVPDKDCAWTLALDVVSNDKLLKIEAVTGGTWTPKEFSEACTADGDLRGKLLAQADKAGIPIVSGAPRGCLIGRIGGSSADLPRTLKDKAPESPSISPWILFSVGQSLVLQVPGTPIGSLFLGVNDDATRMLEVQGQLVVNLYEAS